MMHNTLTVEVRYMPGTSAKVRIATEIIVKLGPITIASKVCGGRYSQRTAMVEFQRNPQSFKKFEGYEDAMKVAA